jgi:two-component system LytT family response regulator
MIRTVIIDDEPLATTNLRHMLAAHADVRIVGTAANATAASELLAELQPELAFLDVRMPRGTGFDVLRALPADRRPLVVFVTAYDSYAIAAFDIEAVDYIEKPPSARRLSLALERVRTRLGQRREQAGAPPAMLQLSEGASPVFARRDDIVWIAATGRHAVVHCVDREVRVRNSISALLERLDPSRFVRVHRSTVVHLTHLRALRSARHGDLDAELSSGATVRVSRRHRAALERTLASLRAHAS